MKLFNYFPKLAYLKLATPAPPSVGEPAYSPQMPSDVVGNIVNAPAPVQAQPAQAQPAQAQPVPTTTSVPKVTAPPTTPTTPATPTAPKSVNRTPFTIGTNNKARVGQGTSYSAMARAMGGNVTARQLQDYAKTHLGGSFKANKEYDFNDIRKNLNMPGSKAPAYRPAMSQQFSNLQPSLNKAQRANTIRQNFSFQGDANDGSYGGVR
jgi:hypothetical protein